MPASEVTVTTARWALTAAHLSDLYAAMGDQGVRIRSGSLGRWTFARATAGTSDVFHLNWLDHLAAPASVPRRAVMALRLVFYLTVARMRGRHVWWTVHNVEPHDRPNSKLFAATMPLAFVIVGTVHFLSDSAKVAFLAKYPPLRLMAGKTHVTPLPTNALGAGTAQRHKPQEPEPVTFLLFGILRRAKNVVQTISSFSAPSDGAHTRRLVVAGQPIDEEYAVRIAEAAEGSQNVEIHPRHHGDDELLQLLHEADWGVFLYERVSNSGALLAALDAELPAITSDHPFFREVFGAAPYPGEIVSSSRLMSGADWDRLSDVARTPAHRAMRQVARATADLHHPSAVASTLIDRLSSTQGPMRQSGHSNMIETLQTFLRPALDMASRWSVVASMRARRFSRSLAAGSEYELRLVAARTIGVAFVDVGANAGMFTAMAVDSGASSVLAVEPIPELAQRLRTTFGRRITVIQAALSSAPGRATLRIPIVSGIGRPTRASLDPDSHDVDREFEVDVQTIDDLGLSSNSMVKIDVEGHELDVLGGAQATLAKRLVGTWLIEAEVRNQPTAVSDLVSIMTAHNYVGWAILPGSLVPAAQFDAATHQPPNDQDAVAAGGPRPNTYANNFCFVRAEDRRAFTETAATVGFHVVASDD